MIVTTRSGFWVGGWGQLLRTPNCAAIIAIIGTASSFCIIHAPLLAQTMVTVEEMAETMRNECAERLKGTPSVATYIHCGIAMRMSGNNAAAVDYFSNAIGLDPSDAEAYYNRGLSYSSLTMHQQGLSDFSRAIALNSRNGDYFLARSFSYYEAHNYDHSWQDLHSAQALGADVPPPFLEELRRASGSNE